MYKYMYVCTFVYMYVYLYVCKAFVVEVKLMYLVNIQVVFLYGRR